MTDQSVRRIRRTDDAHTDANVTVPERRSLTRMALPNLGVRLPRVSVIVGCFNQGAFVVEALKSVAAQTYDNLECIVVDDHSSDDSAAYIESALAQLGDTRFRAILRTSNGGQMAAMLGGLDATNSPFVAFLDADDLWAPEFLEAHVSAHLSETAVAAVSASNLAVIAADGTLLTGAKPNFTQTESGHRWNWTRDETHDGDVLNFIPRGIPWTWFWSATSAMVFRRDVLEILRPSKPEQFRICADLYLVRSAHMLGGTVRLERTLGRYRMHGANGYARNRLLGSNAELGRTPPEIVSAAHKEFAERLLANFDALETTLSARYIAMLVAHAARGSGSIELTTRPDAKAVLRHLPSKDRRKLFFRRIRTALRRRR